MSSKSKNSFIEDANTNSSSNTLSRNESAKKLIFSNNLSPLSSPILGNSGLTAKRRPPLSKLASLPFRYAFDGFSRTNSVLTKQNTIPSPSSSRAGFNNESMSAQQHFSSSSLSGRCNSSQNGDCSTSEVEISEENLGMIKKKQNSIGSSDLEDFKSSSLSNGTTPNQLNMSDSTNQVFEPTDEFQNHNYECVTNETSVTNTNNQTLPTRLPESDILVSNLKKYAVRRHHSAPQSDAKWLQVRSDSSLIKSLILIIICNLN